MSLNRVIRASGNVSLSSSAMSTMNVSYEYTEESAPTTISFNTQESSVFVNGNYDPVSYKISNYNVSGGIVDESFLEQVSEALENIVKNYKTA